MADPFAGVADTVGGSPAGGSADPFAGVADTLTPTPEAEKSSGEAVLGALTSLAGGINRGVIKGTVGVADLINMSPMLMNLLPGEQGFEPITERFGITDTGSPFALTETAVGALADVGGTTRTAKEADVPFLSNVGEIGGTALPLTAGTMAASTGTQAITKGITAPIREAARSAPGSFAAFEGTAALTAGVGGSLAIEMFPGDPTAQILGEIAGGFFSPGVIAARSGPAVVRKTRQLLGSQTRAGTEKQAAEEVQRIVRERGGDPEQIAQGITPDVLTPGAQTGDPGLMAIERSVLDSNARLREQVDANTAKALSDIEAEVFQMGGTGSPETAQDVTGARLQRLQDALDTRIQQAALEARVKVQEVLPDLDPAAVRQRTSVETRDALGDALKDARAQERSLWEAVPSDESVPIENTMAAFNEARATLPRAQRDDMPEVARRLLVRGEEGDPIPEGALADIETVHEIRGLRSKLLETARVARSNKEFNKARIADDLADATLLDLDAVEGAAAQEARDFSRILNDRFTRGTVGKILGTGREGGGVPPQEVLPRTVGRGGMAARTGAQDLTAAAPATAARQQEFLRAMAMSTVDKNGKINRAAMQRFLNQNRDVLQEFPALRQRLSNADEAQRLADETIGTLEARKRNLTDKRVSRAQVFIEQRPDRVMTRIVSGQSANPAKDLRDAVRMASKDASGEATAGIKSSFIRAAFAGATESIGARRLVSGQKFRDILVKPQSKGRPGLLPTAIKEGLLTGEEGKRLLAIAKRMDKIERQIANNVAPEQIADDQSALFDFVTRVVGANIGAESAVGQSTGAPIVVAGAGSRMAQRLAGILPRQRIMDVIGEAVQDPKLMKMLLLKPTSAKQREALQRRLNAFLLDNGYVEPVLSEEEQAPSDPFAGQAN